MGFTYPDKFTYLNTFMMEMAQRCSDNGGPTISYSTVVLYIGIMEVRDFLP